MVLKLLNLIALLCAIAWFTSSPGWEPAVASIGLFTTLVAKELLDRHQTMKAVTIPADVTYVSGDLGRSDVNPDALELFLQGRKARDQNRLKAAREFFDRAFALQKNYWEALFERAHCDRRLRRTDCAIETLKYIVQYCPIAREVNRSHTELGVVYHDLKELEPAYREFEIAYDTANDKEENPVPIANLFSHAMMTERYATAEKLREELIQHKSYKKVRNAIESELSAAGIQLELPPT